MTAEEVYTIARPYAYRFLHCITVVGKTTKVGDRLLSSILVKNRKSSAEGRTSSASKLRPPCSLYDKQGGHFDSIIIIRGTATWMRTPALFALLHKSDAACEWSQEPTGQEPFSCGMVIVTYPSMRYHDAPITTQDRVFVILLVTGMQGARMCRQRLKQPVSVPSNKETGTKPS